MTENQNRLLNLLNDFLIEIRALEDGDLATARLIANALHKVPGYLMNWSEEEVPTYVADIEARLKVRPQTAYLLPYLTVRGLR